MSKTELRAAKPVTGVVTLFALLLGFVAIAPAAFAHHAYLASAGIECDTTTGTAQWRVPFTASSWSTGQQGSHSNIQILWSQTRITSGQSISSWVNAGSTSVGATTAFNSTVGFSRSGSFTIPLSVTGTIYIGVYANGAWANGQGGGELWGSSTGETGIARNIAVTVPSPSTCTVNVPATPGASAVADCASGNVNVTLTNVPTAGPGQTKAAANLRVRVGSYDQVHVVAPGATVPVAIPFATAQLAENGSATVLVTGTSGTTFNQSIVVERDCEDEPEPSASASKDCATHTFTVTLTNGNDAGGESVDFVVTRDGGAPQTVTVPAGSSVPVPFTVDEDGAISVAVTAPGYSETFSETFDCQAPAPSASFDECAAGGVLVTLANDGDQGVTLVVREGGDVVHTVVLAAGASTTRTVTVAEGDAYAITVEVQGGDVIGGASGTRDCQHPDVDIELAGACAATGVEVTLTNTGDDSGEYVVTNNGTPVPGLTGTLGAGDSITLTVPVAEGAAYDITATVDGESIGSGVGGTRECTNPQFTGVQVCATGGVTVTLNNTGSLPAVVTLTGAPGAVTPNPVTVPAGGTATVSVTQAEDSAGFTLTGTSSGNSAITIAVPARDCDIPEPTLTLADECAADGVVVTLGNEDGEDEATFTVTNNGSPVGDPVTVAAGASETFTVPVAEGAAYSIDATVAGGYDVTGGPLVGTRDCQSPVLSDVHECVAGGVLIVISNEDGELPVTVTVPGADEPTKEIPAGGTAEFFIPQDEGDPGATVTVDTGEGNEDIEVTYGERDCVEPQVPEISYECGEGEVVFSVVNDGELPATFEVTVTDGNGDPVVVDGVDENGKVTVPGGESAELTFPVEENGTYSVSVTEATAGAFPTQQVVVDCIEPNATITHECADDAITVTLTNDGELPTEYTVTVDGEVIETVTVQPGDEPVVVTIPVEEGETYQVVVTEATEGVVAEAEIEVDCVEVLATVVEYECGDDAILVTLGNEGDEGDDPTVYTVTVNGEVVEVVTLNPGDEPVVVSIPVEENGTYEVVVTEATEGIVLDTTIEVDCIHVGSTPPTVECAEGEIVVEVTNPGDPTDVTVTLLDEDGNVVDEIVLEDFTGTAEVVFEDPGTDGTYTVVVDAPGDDYNEAYEVVVDCRHSVPHVRVSDPCVSNGIAVTVGNDGDEAAEFVIRNNGAVVHTLSVDGGAPDVTRLVPVGEDAAYAIQVTADGIQVNGIFSGIRDCTEVLGTQQPRGTGTGTQVLGTQLPRTGSNALSILPLALGLTLAGFGLTVIASERRRMVQALHMASQESRY